MAELRGCEVHFLPRCVATAAPTRAGSLVASVTVELPPLAALHSFRINK